MLRTILLIISIRKAGIKSLATQQHILYYVSIGPARFYDKSKVALTRPYDHRPRKQPTCHVPPWSLAKRVLVSLILFRMQDSRKIG